MRKRPIERTEEHIAPMHAQKRRRLSTVGRGQADLYRRMRSLGLTSGRFPRIERPVLVLQVQLSRSLAGQGNVIRMGLSSWHGWVGRRTEIQRVGRSGPTVRQPVVIPSTAVDDLPGPSIPPTVHDTIQLSLIFRNLALHPIRSAAGSDSSFLPGLQHSTSKRECRTSVPGSRFRPG